MSDAINSIVPYMWTRDNKLYLKGMKQQACVLAPNVCTDDPPIMHATF